jgi:hypothetical protein
MAYDDFFYGKDRKRRHTIEDWHIQALGEGEIISGAYYDHRATFDVSDFTADESQEILITLQLLTLTAKVGDDVPRYIKSLLREVYLDEYDGVISMNVKRPFGNSDWEHDIRNALSRTGEDPDRDPVQVLKEFSEYLAKRFLKEMSIRWRCFDAQRNDRFNTDLSTEGFGETSLMTLMDKHEPGEYKHSFLANLEIDLAEMRNFIIERELGI